MFSSLIRKRRSIRRYLNMQVETEKVDLLIEAALRAPSSRAINPWEFIVVTDRAVLKKLSRTKPHGSSFLIEAPLGIVVCGDAEKSDMWIEDCSIASTYIQLASESIGLGSCWIQIRGRRHDPEHTAEDYVAEVLNIPSNVRVESIIAVGYPDEIKEPHKKEELQYGKVHIGRYGGA